MTGSLFLGFLWALCKVRGERGNYPFSVAVSGAAERREEAATDTNPKQRTQDHTECIATLKTRFNL